MRSGSECVAVVALWAGLLAGCEPKAPVTAAASEVDSGAGLATGDTAAKADLLPAGTVSPPAAWVTDPALTPRSVHMTWQGDPATTVSVQWTTGATTLAGYVPKIWFAPKASAGKDGELMLLLPETITEGSGEVYYQTLTDITEDTPHSVTWTAELRGLQPKTEYVFRVGTWSDFSDHSLKSPNLSALMSVRTGPTKGSSGPVSVVLAGDSRGGTTLIRAQAERLGKIDADFWVFNGDFNETGFFDQWDDWFDAMTPILSRRPLMPVQGNHEFFPPTFYGQFALPVMGGLPEEMREHAWSMDYANIHFIGLESMSESTVELQNSWLEADLQAAKQDPSVKWIIAMMHHAPYSASNHGSTEHVQKHWVPLFEKYNVDLVFSGHDHNYERSWPWRENKQVGAGEGPVYVVAGGFFADGYSNGKEAWTATSTHGDKYNYVVLTVEGAKLEWKAYSGDGTEVLDTYAIQK